MTVATKPVGAAEVSDDRVPALPAEVSEVTFDRCPGSYRHWNLRVDGPVAWLEMDVDEQGGLVPGYDLKPNSYDLGVDIELYDAVQRLRFEHPGVRSEVMTSAKENVFCAGANIRMLAASSHSWKVNQVHQRDAQRHRRRHRKLGADLPCGRERRLAGGRYELALACDKIVLIDDNSSTVALPEVPLL
jgi:benzoyl-CoA-dihydrodiol lyase